MALSMSDGSSPPFGFSEQVDVCTDSTCNTTITGAEVRVNGTALGWDSGKNRYSGTVLVASGASVTLQVTTGGTTYSVTGTQYTAAPTLSAPTSGASWNHANANSITWSGGAPTTGAHYFVGIVSSDGSFVFPAGDQGPLEETISTTTQTVPGGALSAGDYMVMVGIGSTGLANQTTGGLAISGAASGSALWLGLLRPLVPITVY